MRGGYRPGSGRKPLEGERRTLTLRLPLDCIAVLERLAAENGTSKTDIVVRLLRNEKI